MPEGLWCPKDFVLVPEGLCAGVSVMASYGANIVLVNFWCISNIFAAAVESGWSAVTVASLT
eukprot:COSAG01_NODE_8640_length_2711_cov_8.702144_3_plen_62_part_00